MGGFMAPWSAGPGARWRVARGDAVDPAVWSPFAVREALYTGALDLHARVWAIEDEAPPDAHPADLSRWPHVGSVPEFGAVLRVRGLPLGPEDGARRLATPAEARKRVRITETAPAPTVDPGDDASPAGSTAHPATPTKASGPTPGTSRPPGGATRTVRVLDAPAPSRPVPAGLVIGGTVLLVALAMWLFLSA
jgi:hypothetical protein